MDKEVLELECLIRRYNDAYRKGNPLVTDREFDQLVEQFNARIHVGMRGHIPILERELEDCGAIGAAMLPMSKLK